MIRYLLDANVFIEAKNRHYGFDFCPAFWDWLIMPKNTGRIASIDKVSDELKAGNDKLSTWATQNGSGLFLPVDFSTIATHATTVSAWVSAQSYERTAIEKFLETADYWLVVYAVAQNYTIVTHEVSSDSKRKIKIPNVCTGLNLNYVNPYKMLQRENVKFVLYKP